MKPSTGVKYVPGRCVLRGAQNLSGVSNVRNSTTQRAQQVNGTGVIRTQCQPRVLTTLQTVWTSIFLPSASACRAGSCFGKGDDPPWPQNGTQWENFNLAAENARFIVASATCLCEIIMCLLCPTRRPKARKRDHNAVDLPLTLVQMLVPAVLLCRGGMVLCWERSRMASTFCALV